MTTKTALALLVLAAAAAAPVRAQTASVTDLPDRFQIDGGAFRLASDTQLVLSRADGSGSEVDFEETLDLPSAANSIWLNGYWRVGRRHTVNLSFATNNRNGDPVTGNRDLQWGDYLIGAGAAVSADLDSTYLAGSYRFAAYRNERFEVGPLVGLGYLWLTARLDASGSITVDGETATRQISEEGSKTAPTAGIGAYTVWTPARRVVVRGDIQWIGVTLGQTDYTLVDGRAGLDYYFTRHFGVGAQYKYNRFQANAEGPKRGLFGRYRYQGGQFYLTTRF
jgi:hypothetical protein